MQVLFLILIKHLKLRQLIIVLQVLPVLFDYSNIREYSDEEEQEGEGAYPAEEFCIPWHMADFADDFHFAEDGDGIHPGLIDGVAEEAVAVLNGYVFYKDRVGFRRFQRVQGVHVIIACSLLIDVNAVVLYV